MNISIIIVSANETRIGKKTILQKQYESIKRAIDNPDIVVVSKKDVDFYRENVSHIRSLDSYNTSYLAWCGLKKAKYRKVLIISGESVFNKHCFNMEFKKENKVIVTDNKPSNIGCSENDGVLQNVFYGLPLAWSGILYLSGKNIDQFKDICLINKNKFLFESINDLINTNKIYIERPDKAKSILVTNKKEATEAENI